ncbi:Fe-S cluster assembly ATPase SufC [Candidatus Schneideria nysicola]|uniref:Fe-S cluster assembly ATPase SufC n=1 Tax=Candidatus Schneideria nysicola TaxID=1081631 RepID=UPI001CAA715D|nr:Fe-S cluster assembly ATPase SufC [Candidatus Schneideria nysicola]UAJ65281.1 Fe-S cluster assembly ATPase SufC [Candidatus Schneideria nysicola]UAJ66348.1 Fe-S cluster assembly ATPase SufC [Candidatus Schneideria nysicola]
MLSIKDLHVSIEDKPILNGLNLEVKCGEIHAIMGPNGSGKSTLSATLSGNKKYIIHSGIIKFKHHNLLKLNTEERAREGLFVAFQYPVEIPGVSNKLFLQTAINSKREYQGKSPLDQFDFTNFISEKMKLIDIPLDLLNRSVNVDFSGGEKKRNDILQMIALEPDLCILDETDSGLDIDALKIVTNGIKILFNTRRSFIIITHYKRILDYIQPDHVHVLYKGKIIKSGNADLATQLEEKGYGWIIDDQ